MSAERLRFTVFGFASVHDTIAAEDALVRACVTAVTIPAPKELGELCGIAIRVRPQDADAANRALERAGTPALRSAEIEDF
jgi:hypothetical protein